MFSGADSFYYCLDGDLTNTIQRQHQSCSSDPDKGTNDPENTDKRPLTTEAQPEPVSHWRKADDRFFWNKYLLTDLIESQVKYYGFIFEKKRCTEINAVIIILGSFDLLNFVTFLSTHKYLPKGNKAFWKGIS